MSKADYLAFWKNVKKGRDKHFVHNEFSEHHRGEFPDLDVFKRTALEMRDIICEVVISEEKAEDPERHKLFKELVQWNKNAKYLRDIQGDAERLKELTTDQREAEPEN